MRKILLPALLAVTFHLPSACFAQSAADVNALLKKSKFVDTGRMVNSTVSADKTTISTYSNPKASDQDCKVTALLMMKELKQHYKSIHRIQVLFYDPADPRRFREVEIREGDILLVDQGKPLSVVLSEIDVAHHASAQPPSATPTREVRTAPYLQKSQQAHGASIAAVTNFQPFKSVDGDATFTYPKDWTTEPTDGNLLLFKAGAQSSGQTCVLALYRHPGFGMTLENLCATHQADGKKLKNFRELSHRIQSSNGLPSIYTESSAQYPNGTDVIEQAGYVKGQNHLYLFDMVSSGMNSSETSRLFQTIFSSLRIRD